VITGLYTPDTGKFELAGKPYEPTAVHKVARAGIARTFQNIRLFAEMTALENVMVGRHVRTHSGLLGAVFRTKGFKAEEAAIAPARASCSTMSASANMRTSRRAPCPMATSAAWRLPVHWRRTRS
jgi:ABC-type branched-subunit amino acid transport system ATPase component